MLPLLTLLLPFTATSADTTPPNVLFIVADDLNDYVIDGRYPGVQTPHLDAFLETAVLFEHAYCAAPACVPSRAAFLSGQYPFRTGAYLNGSDPWQKPAMANVESLPESFRQSGYVTWGAGKLFHCEIGREHERAAWDNAPTHRGGFGPFLPAADQLAGKWWGAGPWSGPDHDFPDVVNADAAIDFLRQPQDTPFFLMLGLWRPHTPFTAPRRFFQQYDKQQIQIPPPGWSEDDLTDIPAAGIALTKIWGERWEKTGQTHPEHWRQIVWGYLACTSFADWSIGRVLDALDESPHTSNTLVVITSDNGYHCGEKNHFEKSTLWEAAARVPLAIRLPHRRNAGQRTAATVTLVDLYPTFVDYCRLRTPPQPLDGRSLRKILENPETAWNRPAITVYEEQVFSARNQQHRYIQYRDGSEELYDHHTDPFERKNLAKDSAGSKAMKELRKGIPRAWAKSLGGREG